MILVYTIRQFQIIDNESLTTEYTVKQVNCEAGTSNPYEAGNSSTIKKSKDAGQVKKIKIRIYS
jgi:hypothetical protein